MSEEQKFGEEFYSAYAAGTLDPALILLIETQASLKENVRRMLHMADCVSTIFFEAEKPARMNASALDKTLSMIDQIEQAGANPLPSASTAGNILDEMITLPEPLRDRALKAAGGSGWKFGGPGLKSLPLDIKSSAKVELIRIEPGCGAPEHTHTGQEYTLVVAGGFTDETGSYGPGDLSIAGPDDHHRPIADEGEVCYALAVTDGELQFKGWLGVVQKLFC